jgi:16S rRNA (adenine1518-N6/adenine1519-N6)-dimethyltransferase
MVSRLGQNFLADTNLLEAIVRDAHLDPGDVALEVGAGEGALSDRVAPRVAHLHAVELDRRLAEELESVSGRHANLSVLWGDAMRIDLRALLPTPTAVVSNLPYSIATPVLLRTIAELPDVAAWTVMVQREIADRLRASPGSRTYGAPSVLVQLSCEVELLRAVDRAVFRPRPRVDSALLRLRRRAAAAPPALTQLVRAAFGHRRKPIAGSLELAGGPSRETVRGALRALGLDSEARAEALAPADYVRLAERLEVH